MTNQFAPLSELVNSLQKKTSMFSESEATMTSDDIRRLAILAQDIALQCRKLYAEYTEEEQTDEEIRLKWLEELGYKFIEEEGCVMIELPLLLPKRNTNCNFILNPLDELLGLCSRKIARFKKCAVLFTHCYSERHKAADIRDHDNIETRAVLNVIERHLLYSDSGYYCQNIQTTITGKSDKTIITIVSREAKQK